MCARVQRAGLACVMPAVLFVSALTLFAPAQAQTTPETWTLPQVVQPGQSQQGAPTQGFVQQFIPQAPIIVDPNGAAKGAAQRSGQVKADGLLAVPLQGQPPKGTELPKDQTTDAGKEQPATFWSDPKDVPKSTTGEPKSGSGGVAMMSGEQGAPPSTQEALQKSFLKAQEPPMNGSFTQELRLDLPAFRGLEPKLRLVYDSNHGLRAKGATAGMLGVSWRLDGLSEIVRTARVGGAPRFDGTTLLNTTDKFELDGDELVACVAGMTSPSCTTGGSHTTRVESYRRIKLDTGTNRWTVTAKDGTRYEYHAVGTFPYTATPDAAITTSYRWLLKSIIGLHTDHVVTFTYQCATLPICWPTTIAYNGTEVAFQYDTRPDPLSYATGKSLAISDKRLRTIDIKTGGNRVRAYALAYDVGTSTALSRLTSVTPYGRDATVDGSGLVTGGSALPATTFAYSEAGPTTTKPIPSWLPSPSHPYEHAVFGDFKGTGRKDVVVVNIPPCNPPEGSAYCPQSTISHIRSSDLNGNFTSQAISFAANQLRAGVYKSESWLAKDFDGDGKDDLLRFTSFHLDPDSGWTSASSMELYRAVPAGFQYAASAYFTADVTIDLPRHLVALGDFDGDGRSEILIRSVGMLRYNGSQFVSGPVSVGGGFGGGIFSGALQFYAGDFNGDGKTDILEAVSGGSKVWLSSGTSFVAGPLQASLLPAGATAAPTYTAGGYPRQHPIGDFNGDGKSDLAVAYFCGSNTCVHVVLSQGHSFTASTWATGLPRDAYVDMLSGDFNGDGRSDLTFGVFDRPSPPDLPPTAAIKLTSRGGSFDVTPLSAALPQFAGDVTGDGRDDIVLAGALFISGGSFEHSAGLHPDLMSQTKSQYGGITRLTYTPSSQWVNNKLPFVLQTISDVEQDNGLGTVGTAHFGYSGGFFDSVERRFLGFRTARTVLPCNVDDTVCPERRYTFRQDVASAGALEVKEYWTGPTPGAGVKLRQDNETWVVNTNPAALPYWARNTVSEAAEYDGGVTKTTRTERTFDAYNNVLDLWQRGDTATAADDRLIRRAFYPNTAAYIVDHPASEQRLNGSLAVLAEARFHYDGAGAHTVAVGPKGDLTQRSRWLNLPPSGGSNWVSRVYTYDAQGNRLSDTDEVGCRTEWSYDATYKILPIETRSPLYFGCLGASADTRQKTTAAYTTASPASVVGTLCQKPLETRDIDNLVTATTYDQHCRADTVTKPGGQWTQVYRMNEGVPATQYDATFVTPPNGTANVYTADWYDGFGRTRAKGGTAPAPFTSWLAYTTFNPRGKAYQESTPAYTAGSSVPHYWSTHTYDALDRLVQSTHPDSATLTMSYAGGGLAFNTVTVRDELGRDTVTHKDGHGRAVRLERFLGNNGQVGGTANRMTLAYDLIDNLVQVQDEPGNTWSATYDSLSRRLSVSDPDHGAWTFTYDAAGRLATQRDANSAETRMVWDGLGRQKRREHYNASLVLTEWHDYVYDEVRAGYWNGGELTSTSGLWGSTQHDHDANGHKVRDSWTLNGSTYAITTSRDAGGYLVAKGYSDGDAVGGTGNEWLTDEALRLKSIPGHVTGFVYNARGQVVQATYANGVVTTNTYNEQRGWLTRVQTVKGPTVLQDIAFTRGATGRISAIASAGRPEDSWTYTYDDLDRLLTATNTGNGTLSQTFTYDSAHNMLTNSQIGSYSYPPQGPGSIRPHAATAAGSFALQYDAAGNLTRKLGPSADLTVFWNAENKLGRMLVGAAEYRHLYGADHARVMKIATQAGGDVVTRYLGPDAEIEPSGTWVKYVHDDVKRKGNAGAAQPFFHHRDHLKTIRVITDASGAEVNRTIYRAYGQKGVQTGAHTETKGYIGQRHDDESGFLFLNARFYDPHIARFVSPDWWDPSKPGVGANRYTYSDNDPINKSDENGHVFGFDNAIGAVVGVAVDAALQGYGIATGKQSSFSIGQSVVAGALGFATSGLSAVAGQLSLQSVKSLAVNKAVGLAAEKTAEAQMKAQGFSVIGTQVGTVAAKGNQTVRSVADLAFVKSKTVNVAEVKVAETVQAAAKALSTNQRATMGLVASQSRVSIAPTSKSVAANYRNAPVVGYTVIGIPRSQAAQTITTTVMGQQARGAAGAIGGATPSALGNSADPPGGPSGLGEAGSGGLGG